jgi:hypothetical protein
MQIQCLIEHRPKIMYLQKKSDTAKTLNVVYEVTSVVILLKPVIRLPFFY